MSRGEDQESRSCQWPNHPDQLSASCGFTKIHREHKADIFDKIDSKHHSKVPGGIRLFSSSLRSAIESSLTRSEEIWHWKRNATIDG